MVDFVGYSTVSGPYGNWKLTDIELVKQDLINEFQTRKGERLRRPNFGSIIWDMMFEMLTDENRIIIEEDVRRIVERDPRTTTTSIEVTEFEYGYRINVLLDYVGSDIPVPLEVTFDQRNLR